MITLRLYHGDWKLWRVKWDDELEDYDYMSRTAAPDWDGYPQAPAVFRFAPSPSVFEFNYTERRWQTGDYRVNISSLETFTRNLLYNEPSKWTYWTDPETGQFNGTGWAQLAYLLMSDNVILGRLTNDGNFVQFRTLTVNSNFDGLTYKSVPWLINRFSLVKWSSLGTTHSYLTPKGIIDYPVVSKEGLAYFPVRYLRPVVETVEIRHESLFVDRLVGVGQRILNWLKPLPGNLSRSLKALKTWLSRLF